MNDEKTPRVLTIQRSKWRRGGDVYDNLYGETYLLNEKGKMCCLGFDALACGFTEEQILDVESPAVLASTDCDFPPNYLATRVVCQGAMNTNIVQSAIEHNDNQDIDDATREALVRADLIALGWDDVVFVD